MPEGAEGDVRDPRSDGSGLPRVSQGRSEDTEAMLVPTVSMDVPRPERVRRGSGSGVEFQRAVPVPVAVRRPGRAAGQCGRSVVMHSRMKESKTRTMPKRRRDRVGTSRAGR